MAFKETRRGFLSSKCMPTAGQRERPRRPCGVELVPQFIFVGEAIQRGRMRALRSGQHGQHRVSAARAVCAPPAVEDAFAILPQELEITQPISVELKDRVHLPDSAAPASVRLLHALLCDSAVVRGTKQAWEPQEGRTADSTTS